MRQKISLLTALLLCSVLLNAQQSDQWVPTADQLVTMPTSPEAAAFAKYGGTPVSHYNGTPNISVPLAGLKGRSITVPLSLTYDASGIKVEQLASHVGLGWNLNAGGAVTRQVHGLPDDYIGADLSYYPFYSDVAWDSIGSQSINAYYDYYLNNDMQSGSHSATMVQAYPNFINKFESRELDTQPDTYSFSAMGLSGTFYIDYDSDLGDNVKKGVAIGNPELKIEVKLDAADLFGVRNIAYIDITDKTGTRYHFDQQEHTYQFDNDADVRSREYASAYRLSYVYTANDRDIVQFVYTAGTYWTSEQYTDRGHVLRGIANETPDCSNATVPASSAAPTHKVKQPVLQSIKINNIERAVFENVSDRLDLPGQVRLDKIRIKKSDASSENHIKFYNTGYFNSFDSPVLNEWERRLKLTRISFWGSNGAYENFPTQRSDYDFTYDETYRLPSRDSKAQDYWGYYNGQSNQSLIPADAGMDGPGFSGGNRSVSEAHMKAGVLTRIDYPTGGYSEFSYQANYYEDEPVVSERSTFQTVQYGSGALTGAENSNDPADYDGCGDVGPTFPDLYESSFTVTEDGIYNLEVDITTGAFAGNPIAWAFLYKGGLKSFCDLTEAIDNNDQEDILFFTSSTAVTSFQNNYFLQSHNTYRIMLVSNSRDLELKVSREEAITSSSSSSQNFEVGGLRVYKNVDKPDAGTVASTRYFYYDDLSQVSPTTTFDSAFFEGNDVSSAVLQQPVSMQSLAPAQQQDDRMYKVCEFVNRLSTNQYRAIGGIIGYSKVTEVLWAGDEINGFTVYHFHNDDRSTQFQTDNPSLNGRVEKQQVYDKDFSLLQESISEYESIGLIGTGGLLLNTSMYGYYNMQATDSASGRVFYEEMPIKALGSSPALPQGCVESAPDCLNKGPQNLYSQSTYGIGENWLRLKKVTQTNYDGPSPQVTKTTNFYHSTPHPTHYEVIRTLQELGNSHTYTTTLEYPADLSAANMSNLVADHRTGEVIKTTMYEGVDTNGTKLNTQNTTFMNDNGKLYPEKMQFSLNTNTLEDRIVIHSYDDHGNIREVSKEGDNRIVYLWGYNSAYPVAMIQNASYSDVQGLVSQATLDSPLDDATLRTELDLLRTATALKDALITTMTYDPSFGMTSQTTPNGLTTYYEYDNYGRLELVKDKEGNILKKNVYTYQVDANTTGN